MDTTCLLIPNLDNCAIVEAITRITPCAWRLRLRVRGRDLRAGQYVELISSEGISRYFSVASQPQQLKDGTSAFDLLVSSRSTDQGTAALIAALRTNDTVNLAGPFGRATLRDYDQPGIHIFVSYDSGYAYVRGLLEELLTCKPSAKAALFRFSRAPTEFPDVGFLNALGSSGGPKVYDIIEEANWPTNPAKFILKTTVRADPHARPSRIYVGGGACRASALIHGLLTEGIPAQTLVSDHLPNLEKF